jgi:cytoskeleton protein RodZ
MSPIRSQTRSKTAPMRVVKPKDAPAVDDVRSGTGFHIGETLRDARQQRGLDLDMVANELMIRRFYLEALEQGSFKDLPEHVYATGFVRNYANYLGLDAAQAVEQFKREAYGTRSGAYQVELVMPQPVTQSVMPGRSAILSACIVLGAIVTGIIVANREHGSDVAVPSIPAPASALDVTVPSLPNMPLPDAEIAGDTLPPDIGAPTEAPLFDVPETVNVATPAAVTATDTSPQAAAQPNAATATTATAVSADAPADASASPGMSNAAAITGRVVVEALQSSWVEIKDTKGVILFTNILKAGQLLPIPDQAGVTLTTGNAGGLRVLVDGKAVAPIGQPNEVKRNVPLDISALGTPAAN